MNEKEKAAKVQRFLADEAMSRAIREAITDSFLKRPKEYDTLYLAASRIAIDLLAEAFSDLERYRSTNRQPTPQGGQIGL